MTEAPTGGTEVASLAPGQTSNDKVRFFWTPTPGDHVLRFDVDVDEQVAEISELNNSYRVKSSSRS